MRGGVDTAAGGRDVAEIGDGELLVNVGDGELLADAGVVADGAAVWWRDVHELTTSAMHAMPTAGHRIRRRGMSQLGDATGVAARAVCNRARTLKNATSAAPT
jgi:hypothetical protein